MSSGHNRSRRTAAEVVLFLCHTPGESPAKEFRRISAAVGRVADCRVLLHDNGQNDLKELGDLPCYRFTDECLASLLYPWLFKNALVPGSTHFPLMRFFADFPDYQYYWLVEEDVRFSGRWKRFFDAFEGSNADFLACHIRRYADDPHWYWWSTLAHRRRVIPLAKRICSFNPIYRISRRAIEYLHSAHCDGWCGHFEVLIPTLLLQSGFRLRDIGGTGNFVAPGDENRFYTGDTIRYRPAFDRVGEGKNLLYHPVKILEQPIAG
jgi:uncharacterized protein DUF3405